MSNNQVILFIDTSEADTAKVAIKIGSNQYEKIRRSKIIKSQTVLPLIEEILNEHHIRLTDISEIKVVSAKGSFTGLRVGATVANTLAYLLHIPVNGKTALVIPQY